MCSVSVVSLETSSGIVYFSGFNTHSDTPKAEVNHKSLCRQFQLKNQQLSKAYKDIKAKFETLEQKFLEREDHLQQAQDDSDEVAKFVREVEEKVAAFREKIIRALLISRS